MEGVVVDTFTAVNMVGSIILSSLYYSYLSEYINQDEPDTHANMMDI